MPLFRAKTAGKPCPVSRRVLKFFSYYRPYTGLFIADLLCALTVSAVSLIFPLCVRFISGRVLSAPVLPIEALLGPALVLLGLIALQTGCSLFYDHMGHVMGARMERDMRNELFAHYQTLPFSFFDREKPGAIMSRLTGDLYCLAELYHHGPEDLIIYVLTFLGALTILFRLNTGLALAISIFLPPMFFFSAVYSRILNKVYTRNYENISAVNARIEDSIGGIRTVKAFGNEALETEKFRKVNEDYYRSRSAIYKHEARFFTGMAELFPRLIMAVVIVAGALSLSKSNLDVSVFITFILYVSYLTAPIPQIARISAQYQQGISAFNRFMDVLELPGERSSPPPGSRSRPRSPGRNAELEFVNVNFKYEGGAGYVLKNVSFKIGPGEFTALAGPSGIGKSTLCSLIPRFYDPCSGSILINGVNIADMDIGDLRVGIGIVQQDTYVFSGTIAENIACGKPGAPEEEITAAARKAGAHGFITALPGGYGAETGPRGVTLSGGQKQRICIARVFLLDPPLVIFDEATSALDDENERIVREALIPLSRDRTTIVIAHRRSTIKKAGRILVLRNGSIEERR
jgi:ATP-binding cassette subfamily B protein